MNKLILTSVACLLSISSHSALASEQSDGQMVTDSIFCTIYSTRLTQTSDSGLQLQGVNLNARLNGPVIGRYLINLENAHGRAWIDSYARKGSVAAMQLSQSVLYNQAYTRSCEEIAAKIEKTQSRK